MTAPNAPSVRDDTKRALAKYQADLNRQCFRAAGGPGDWQVERYCPSFADAQRDQPGEVVVRRLRTRKDAVKLAELFSATYWAGRMQEREDR